MSCIFGPIFSSLQASPQVSDERSIKFTQNIQQIVPEIWDQILGDQNLNYRDRFSFWVMCKSTILKERRGMIGTIFRRILAAEDFSYYLEQLSRVLNRNKGEDYYYGWTTLQNKRISVVKTFISLAADSPYSIQSINLPRHLFYDLFQQLPSTLVNLSINFGYASPFHVWVLPSNLMNLRLDANVMVDLDFKLPENLTKLQLRGYFLFSDTIIKRLEMREDCDFSLLPQTLIYLETWGIFGKGFSDNSSHLKDFTDLPYKIKEWIFKQLPKSLEHLIIKRNYMYPPEKVFLKILDEKLINTLPRNLQTLELPEVEKINHPTDLPLGLKRLYLSLSLISDISWMENFTCLEVVTLLSRDLPGGIESLPLRVKKLHLPCVDIKLDIDNIERLGNLEELSLSNFPLKGIDLQKLKLPASLTTLCIRGFELKNVDLQYLPRQLRHLSIVCSQMTVEGMKFLPRSLVTLDITNGRRIWLDSEYYYDIPKTLQKFTLEGEEISLSYIRQRLQWTLDTCDFLFFKCFWNRNSHNSYCVPFFDY